MNASCMTVQRVKTGRRVRLLLVPERSRGGKSFAFVEFWGARGAKAGDGGVSFYFF